MRPYMLTSAATLFATVFGLAACDTQRATDALGSVVVSISPSNVSLTVGQTRQLLAAINPQQSGAPSWSSTNTGVASVTTEGVLAAHAPGATKISATIAGVTGEADVTVTAAPPPPPPGQAPVAQVSISPTSGSVQIGQSLQFAATTRDAAGNVLTGRTVTWVSNHPGYAQVDANGRATGISAGTADLVASSEGVSGSASLTVTAAPPPPPAPVATVVVAPATGSISTGQTLQLAATLRDASGNLLTGRSISWSSSSPGVASVSNTGLVSGVAAGGPVTITATSEGRSGTSAVTVTAPPPPPPPAPVATVALAPATASIQVGQGAQLVATLRDAAGNLLTGRTITWSSATPSVASVSASGLVSGVAVGGPVTITATSEGRSGTAAVTVSAITSGTTLFESDWRTATGTGTTALRDGTKWSEWVNYGGPQLLSVVPATGLGFPAAMSNVLRVLQAGESDAEHMQLTNGIPLPTVGSHLYYRIYTRVDEAAQAGRGSDHPVEPMPGACPFLWTFKRQISSTGWTPEWQFSNTPSEEWWNLRVQLQKNTVYRLEWHFHFITASTFKFDTRIYDAAGTLLYTDIDFLSGNFLNQTLAARDPDFRNSNNDCFRHLFVGNNGQANWANTNTYTYWGGVKVCRDGWCGAY
jgi:uncharacterized protein YjdB